MIIYNCTYTTFDYFEIFVLFLVFVFVGSEVPLYQCAWFVMQILFCHFGFRGQREEKEHYNTSIITVKMSVN